MCRPGSVAARNQRLLVVSTALPVTTGHGTALDVRSLRPASSMNSFLAGASMPYDWSTTLRSSTDSAASSSEARMMKNKAIKYTTNLDYSCPAGQIMCRDDSREYQDPRFFLLCPGNTGALCSRDGYLWWGQYSYSHERLVT